MSSRRRQLVLLLLACGAATALAAPRTARMAWLGTGTDGANAAWLAMLKTSMRKLGYLEGHNLTVIMPRNEANVSDTAALAVELMAQKPDVIVALSVAGIAELQKIGKTVPVVMAFIPNPVAAGFAASLARPGGNVTGPSSGIGLDLYSKRLDLMRVLLPSIMRIGVLTSNHIEHAEQLRAVEQAARPLGIIVQGVMARDAQEMEQSFAALAKSRVTGVIALGGYPQSALRQQVGQCGLRYGVAIIAPNRAYAKAGALLSYGVSPAAQFDMVARYIDKILRGAKPGDLPIEQPSQFELVINGKTAAVLGIELTQEMLLRADEVIA